MDQDPIVAAVVAKFRTRSAIGMVEYGVPLSRTDLTVRDWLLHLQGEMMDGTHYIERLLQGDTVIPLEEMEKRMRVRTPGSDENHAGKLSRRVPAWLRAVLQKRLGRFEKPKV